MKNACTAVLLTCLAVLAGFAQPKKGQWLLGGTIDAANRTSTSSTQPAEGKSWQLSVSPKIGFFVADRWALGIAPGFAQSGSKTLTEESKAGSSNIVLFARYYQPIPGKLSIFGELNGISYSTSTGKRTLQDGTTDYEFEAKSVQAGLFIRPGLAYFITPRIGIETSFGSLGYGYSASKSATTRAGETSESKDKGFSGGFNLNYNFNLGVLFYLGQ